ncbi:hypothetical protein RND71_018502 [Anisodus tanguticus]|uniref:Uncharacterized protein n=1 Tax=Anisodus tanguticus TaxID=243964 RepID=A0AAE1S690_9SOLA|nr:hypothetical protein RND71_018502 [Anisodus tanguticus]
MLTVLGSLDDDENIWTVQKCMATSTVTTRNSPQIPMSPQKHQTVYNIPFTENLIGLVRYYYLVLQVFKIGLLNVMYVRRGNRGSGLGYIRVDPNLDKKDGSRCREIKCRLITMKETDEELLKAQNEWLDQRKEVPITQRSKKGEGCQGEVEISGDPKITAKAGQAQAQRPKLGPIPPLGVTTRQSQRLLAISLSRPNQNTSRSSLSSSQHRKWQRHAYDRSTVPPPPTTFLLLVRTECNNYMKMHDLATLLDVMTKITRRHLDHRIPLSMLKNSTSRLSIKDERHHLSNHDHHKACDREEELKIQAPTSIWLPLQENLMQQR